MLIYGRFGVFVNSIVCVLLHEFGHAFVGQKLGYKLSKISLMPYGAKLSGSEKQIDADDDIKISLAGPFVNVILIILCFVLYLIFPSLYDVLKGFVSVNIYTLLFNLLPVFPLDGGRLFVAIMSKKISRTKALKISKIVGYTITALLFVLFFVSFFYSLNYMLGVNAIFLLVGLLDEDTSAYYEKLYPLQILGTKKLSFKSAKFSKDEAIFNVYKKIEHKKISSIKVMDKQKIIAILPSEKIVESILKYPIDTKLKELV